MTMLTSKEDFDKAKSRDMITLECCICKKNIRKIKNQVKTHLREIQAGASLSGSFCSRKCYGAFRYKRKEVKCDQCSKLFIKRQTEIREGSKNFCGHSCSATYQNTHKTHGTRRSKLEKWLEGELPKVYPNLEFHFSRKDAINSELDIYIPTLKLAFELNGIFHYEPIYGEVKLNQIKNNDTRKFQACLEAKIELCTIDSSGLKYFKPEKCQKYLDIIKNIIDMKLVPLPEFESGT